ncbi:acetate--CoA ligase family protein [Microbacterium halotolerans]|uniref:acetate--CoA ligase family protein n=1 Tax=Microbacterium halotolerans TaxID=246613 RepID=UPI0013C2EE64|nr:acetate--CoA ligase family protein [Microbacterium halotolerans]
MRNLAPLLRPRSVAVIGASSTPTSLSGRPVKNLLDSGADVEIYPVNPRRSEIAGLPCYPDIESVPSAPDVALVLTPATAVADTLAAAGKRGTKAAIVITAGFAELGEVGETQQRDLARIAREHDMLLLGPNTIGTHDYRRGLPLSFVWFGRRPPTDAGSIAVVTQSGSGMAALCDRLNDEGLPLGYGVATGNEADVSVADLLDNFADDDDVRVVATVFEGIKDGPAFLRAVGRLRDAGKPVVALKLGRTPSGTAMTASHTGSLAGEYATVSSVLRQHGVIEIDDLDEFGSTLAAALGGKFPEGTRIAAISSSGAATVICADRADELDMELPDFSAEAQKRIAPYLPSFSPEASNPLDLTAQAMEHRNALSDVLEIALAEPDIDAVIVGTPSSTGPKGLETADRFADIARHNQKPFFPFLLTGEEAAAARARQRAHGFVSFTSPGKAVQVVERLSRFARARRRFASLATAVDPPIREQGLEPMSEFDALQWLSTHEVPVVAQELARSPEEASAAAERIGYPVVLKINSPQIAHKTEVGGVILSLDTAEAVSAAYDSIVASTAAARPDATVDGVVVAPMIDVAFELIAGVHHDATFGPVLAFGLGGIWAEALGDVALRAAPITAADAREMVGELRGAALLQGSRGYPAADPDGITTLLIALSQIALTHGAELDSIDLNPVAVTRDGRILALDAAVFTRDLR